MRVCLGRLFLLELKCMTDESLAVGFASMPLVADSDMYASKYAYRVCDWSLIVVHK